MKIHKIAKIEERFRNYLQYGEGKKGMEKECYIKVKDLINHIKNMHDNNVKSELMSLLGGYNR